MTSAASGIHAAAETLEPTARNEDQHARRGAADTRACDEDGARQEEGAAHPRVANRDGAPGAPEDRADGVG